MTFCVPFILEPRAATHTRGALSCLELLTADVRAELANSPTEAEKCSVQSKDSSYNSCNDDAYVCYEGCNARDCC